MKYKPGWKSSEFYFTLVSFIFSGLFLLGIIGNNDQKEELIRDVSHGVESVILIAGQMVILYKYIISRKELKTLPSEENKNEPESKPESEPQHQEDSAANQPRPNKRRSGKTSRKNKRRTKNSSKNSPS